MEIIDTGYIFKTMLGADNTERLKVEELLEKLALEQPENLTVKLLESLSSNDDAHLELDLYYYTRRFYLRTMFSNSYNQKLSSLYWRELFPPLVPIENSLFLKGALK